MLLVIDNYDSFTFNLVQYFGELADKHPFAKVIKVVRNDAISITQIKELNPKAIVLSPGPGDPDQSGVCLEILNDLAKVKPILGVCLGHQAIAQTYGGKIDKIYFCQSHNMIYCVIFYRAYFLSLS